MKSKKLFLSVTLLAVLSTSAVMADEKHPHPPGNLEKLGQVRFPVSCNASVRKPFERAVALLHSFWYEEAGKAFYDVTEKDPQCGMGYWGVAMSLYHPLWEPPDLEALKQGGAAIEKAKAAGAKTDRERDYIAAIETFYKDSDKLDHRTRALANEKAMEQVYRRYPKDEEAAVFYALSLLSTASPTDKTYANQKKAGEILEKIFSKAPRHPGVAHYIIHAYDSPPLAHKAIAAARSYAKIAPSVPHALHMPSHIFTRLGLWQDSIKSNLASSDAARDKSAKNRPGAVSFEDLHALDYLMYARLQQAQDQQAKALLDQINGFQKAVPENFASAYALAAIPARYVIEKRLWSEAESLTLRPRTFPWSRFPWTEAITYFARGVGAARSGDVEAARKHAQKLQSIHDGLLEANQSYWADQVKVQRLAVDAWIARAAGKNEEALRLMRSAADLEDATGKHPVTPGPIVPAREMLGELLLELNQPRQALSEFETSLNASPNRFNGVYGAARSAELSEDSEKARTFYAKLVAASDPSDDERPELQTAKTFLAKK